MKARAHELTAVSGRSLFEEFPLETGTGVEQARWHQFRERYNAAQRLEWRPSFPLQLDFETTSICQLRCRFCVHGQEVVKRKELPRKHFEAAIDEGAEHGLASIKMNYINEPLLHGELFDLIDYARGKGVLNVYFATNGLLLDKTRAQDCIATGVSKVMVSIDAASAETYEKMRGSKKYHEVVENIERLIAMRDALGLTFPRVRVNFLRTQENAHEADAFIARWSGKADMLGFQTQVALPGKDEALYRDEDEDEPFRCSFPFKLMVIDASGRILPCCTFSGRELEVGQMGQTTIREAWAAAEPLRTLHAEGRYRENPTCTHCVEGCS